MRGRMSVGDGTQQRPHGTSADVHGRGGTAAEGEAPERQTFWMELFKQLGDNLTMNIKQGRLLNEVNRSYKYTQMPVETLAGSCYDGVTASWNSIPRRTRQSMGSSGAL